MHSEALVPALRPQPQPMSPTPTMNVELDDSELSKNGTAVRRHPDLWFGDGSVVLRAENVAFRVHKSQLSRQSLFFRDLFSLPQPGVEAGKESNVLQDGGDGMLEGCPVLRLHDDSAEDVTNLLHALYDGGPYVFLFFV